MDQGLVVAVVVGVLQGVFEWLPISSEGNITIALTLIGAAPSQAVAYALFLHVGTAISATVYYRNELLDVLATVPSWRPREAFSRTPTLSFLALATVVSGVVGVAAYLVLETLVSALTGGAFVVFIGVLLVLTGVFQRVSGELGLGTRTDPTALDALLVGGLQGLAILPGVSRSGTTVGALLLRGYDGEHSFRLSFLLSIPAALGGGLIAVLDDGLAGLTLVSGAVALVVAAVVGYATIDALMRVVRRISFWAVCVGLGSIAIVGGVLIVLL